MSSRTATPARRVLITGVGGAPGFDLARAVTGRGLGVIAVDSQPLAPGLLLDDVTPRVVPAAGAPDYAAEMLRLCRDLKPDAVMPTVEAELPSLIDLADDLQTLGVRTWLPSAHAVRACADKSAFHATVSAAGIPTPRTWLPHQIDDIPHGMPLIVKPRSGQGAKDVHRCTRRQAAVVCELVPDPLIQERVTGPEFTADCLVDRAGRTSVVLRYRLLVKGGLAVVAETFHDDTIANLVRATATAVGAVGLCCAQGFITDHGPVMTEMNARIAGAFPLSEAAGADLVGQALNGLVGLPVDHTRLTYRPGVRLTKYIETLTVTITPVSGGTGPAAPTGAPPRRGTRP